MHTSKCRRNELTNGEPPFRCWRPIGSRRHNSRISIASTSAGPMMNRDRYGNIYWMQQFEDDPNAMMMNRGGPRPPSAIDAMEVLANRPDDAWLAHIDDSYKPKISMVVAQLYLKVNEDLKAFPHIEGLAKTHPDKAKDLVNEFCELDLTMMIRTPTAVTPTPTCSCMASICGPTASR